MDFVVVSLLSHVQLFSTSWTVARQAPLSMEFSRQEYWSGLPFPSPGNLPNPEIEPTSPALAGRFFTTEPPDVHKIMKLKCLVKALIIHSILIILLACAFVDTEVLFFELYHIEEFSQGIYCCFLKGCVCVGILPFKLTGGFEGGNSIFYLFDLLSMVSQQEQRILITEIQ